MKVFASLFLFCVIGLELVFAFPSGAPKCSSIKPKHKSNKAQSGASPFKVTTTAVTKNSDGKSTINVSLAASDDTKFKGFILYATAPSSDAKIGSFEKTTGTSVLSCDGSANAITHIDNEDKNSVVVSWVAPDNFSGPVQFKASVVKEFKEFWTGITSSDIQIS